MLNPNIKTAFAYHRSYTGRTTAQRALELARMDLNANRVRYSGTPSAMRGGTDFKLGSDSVFWCEQPDAYLRRVGFADEIARELKWTRRLDIPRGWYTEDQGQGEIARGVVFQLPARNGETRFMYGVADPCNDGPAILSHDIATDKGDAAQWADQLAERYAENERAYNRAWHAGERYRDLENEITDTRDKVRQILSARRDHKRAGDAVPTILKVLECKACELIERVSEMRNERETLFNDYGRESGFND
jgi:hypothetical protein